MLTTDRNLRSNCLDVRFSTFHIPIGVHGLYRDSFYCYPKKIFRKACGMKRFAVRRRPVPAGHTTAVLLLAYSFLLFQAMYFGTYVSCLCDVTSFLHTS
jgi:hypothetical protein